MVEGVGMSADTMTAAMWVHMLEHGGRWTAAEMTAISKCDRYATDKLLASMQTKGIARVYSAPHRRNGRAYGVDATCKIPRGMTLQELMAAMPF